MDFGRVITAMVTPFDGQLQIDWEQTGKLIDYLIDEQRSDSLVICGTTGESPTLSDEEKLELFEFSVRRAAGRCKIIAGTGSNNTAHSVHLTKKAAETGADGILLVAPYYSRPNQEGLYRHFKTIAEHTELPIMLYNIPIRTGINIQAETVIRLSDIPNIVALKEAHSDTDQITRIIEGTPESFRLYSGDDDLTLPMLCLGAHGVVSVCSHVIGNEIQEMIETFLDGNVKEASELHAQLLPVFKGMFVSPNPGPVKYALRLRGIDTGGLRLPLVPPSTEEEQAIERLFK